METTFLGFVIPVLHFKTGQKPFKSMIPNGFDCGKQS
tara:strand:- start:2128 stop:2238 length:111 start_codon:yes stop_codon:yes gene_type:complete